MRVVKFDAIKHCRLFSTDKIIILFQAIVLWFYEITLILFYFSINKEEANLSISESALNNLAFSSDVLCNGGSNVGVYGNSTSSTMEESGAVHLEDKASPARRKRLKCKKKAAVSYISVHFVQKCDFGASITLNLALVEFWILAINLFISSTVIKQNL